MPWTRPRSDRSGTFSPTIRSTSMAPSTPETVPKPPSSQVPKLIGEVTLKVRIMFRKRSGRPRSSIRAAVPSPTAPRATRRELRRRARSEEHTSELQSRGHLVCRLLLEKKKEKQKKQQSEK